VPNTHPSRTAASAIGTTRPIPFFAAEEDDAPMVLRLLAILTIGVSVSLTLLLVTSGF
jgi:hypothetical protein